VKPGGGEGSGRTGTWKAHDPTKTFRGS
jgi:hypothetical protein